MRATSEARILRVLQSQDGGLGLTPTTIAEQAGVSRRTVARYLPQMAGVERLIATGKWKAKS